MTAKKNITDKNLAKVIIRQSEDNVVKNEITIVNDDFKKAEVLHKYGFSSFSLEIDFIGSNPAWEDYYKLIFRRDNEMIGTFDSYKIEDMAFIIQGNNVFYSKEQNTVRLQGILNNYFYKIINRNGKYEVMPYVGS